MLGDAVELKSVGKCARCQMVDVDPSSGMKGNTLRALAQYRRERGKINFGTFFAGNPNAPEGKVWLEEGSRVRSVVVSDVDLDLEGDFNSFFPFPPDADEVGEGDNNFFLTFSFSFFF